MPMERRGARDVTQFRLAPEVCKDGPFRGYARLDWIHSAARKRPTERVGALMHHFTVDNLRRAFQELSGSKATGIDQVTKQEYGRDLDPWFQENWASQGEIVRYADDAVFVFNDEEVAHRFLLDLESRMHQVGLRLNKDKCTVVPFSSTKPKGTFEFLGFRFYCGRDQRKRAQLKVKSTRNDCTAAWDLYDEWSRLGKPGPDSKWIDDALDLVLPFPDLPDISTFLGDMFQTSVPRAMTREASQCGPLLCLWHSACAARCAYGRR